MPLPKLYACGSNGAYQLSLNSDEDVCTPTPCELHPSLDLPGGQDAPIEIVQLVSASTHSLLLLRTARGTVLLGAGSNTLGQMGGRCAIWENARPVARFDMLDLAAEAGLDGEWEPVDVAATWTSSFVVYQRTRDDRLEPQRGVGPSSALRGKGSTDRVEQEQVVVGCGSNDFGELGIVTRSDRVAITRPCAHPRMIDIGLQPGETIQKMRGGQRHVVVLVNGPTGQRLVGWGASRKGELDPLSYTTSRSTAKGKSTYPSTMPPTPIKLVLPPETRIVDVALGASHTLALLSDGSVRGWGSDLKGQITGLDSLEGVVGIGATWGGSYFLTRHGTVLSQGSNSHSQLVRPPTGHVGVVDMDKQVRPTRIVTGSEHLLVVGKRATEQEEELWVGGWNEHGNLGLGDQLDRPTLCRLHAPGKVLGLWGGLAATWIWTA